MRAIAAEVPWPNASDGDLMSGQHNPRAALDPAAEAQALQTGLAHHAAGRLPEAEAIYRQVLARQRDHPDALNLMGAVAFTRGRVDEAIRLIDKAVKLMPSFADAHLNLAEAYQAAGRLPEAADSCRRVIALQPDNTEAHSRLGRLLVELDKPDLALAHCRVALALDPAQAMAQAAQARALQRTRRFQEAEAAYRLALTMQPDDATLLNDFGSLLGETGQLQQALALHQRAAVLRPDDRLVQGNLALSSLRTGAIAAAEAAFHTVTRLAPAHAPAWVGRGEVLSMLGRFDEAAACYRSALALDRNCAAALHGLAHIGRDADAPGNVRLLERMLARNDLAPRSRVIAGFALGKSLADAKRYDDAFPHFAAANAMYRATRMESGQRFDRESLVASVDELIAGRGHEHLQDTRGWGNPSSVPVFVVGMPRSGTSLVEQICASHPAVFGAGELTDVEQMAKAMTLHSQGKKAIADWDAAYARGLADAQVARLSALGSGAARVIDKTPLNVLRLGMISAFFPNAHVIVCSRDARDVSVSNHTLYFAEGNLWSTDLTDCGTVCREVSRLADYWTGAAALRIHRLSYETLVADMEGEARRMIAFLGLDWEPSCLDFHRTVRAVGTPSNWQVRQPIFSSAVGRWRRYERHLGPLLAALEAGRLE
jgi:tetratricopeptide (TPR) repeat protein